MIVTNGFLYLLNCILFVGSIPECENYKASKKQKLAVKKKMKEEKKKQERKMKRREKSKSYFTSNEDGDFKGCQWDACGQISSADFAFLGW